MYLKHCALLRIIDIFVHRRDLGDLMPMYVFDDNVWIAISSKLSCWCFVVIVVFELVYRHFVWCRAF